MSAEELPGVIGGAEGGLHTPDSILHSCTMCPHRAWFSHPHAGKILAGQADTICLNCYMERAPEEGDTARVEEETLRHLESLGISRHRAYTLMADVEDERREEL